MCWGAVAANTTDSAPMKNDSARPTALVKGINFLHEYMTEVVALHELVCDESGNAVDYRILDTNPAFTQVTGIRWEEANGKLASEVYQESPPPYLGIYARVAQSGIAEQFETYYTPMGKYFLISAFCPAPGQFATVATDITLRKEKEAEARRLSHLYAALSSVNQTVVRVSSEDILLDNVCRAVVEKGGFCLAWVGRLNKETRQVMPLAAVGMQPVHKDEFRVMGDDSAESMGPTGRALREERAVVAQLDAADPRLAPWREIVERFQLASAAAFPLYDSEGLWGALAVYSHEKESFTERELALLEEVAADVSFALKRLQAERRQQQMANLLVERERQLQSLLANIPGGVYKCEVHSPWRILFFSEGSQIITGRSPANFTEGRVTYADIVHPEDLPDLERVVEEGIKTHQPYAATYRILRPSGEIRHVYERGQACYDDEGNPLFLEGIVLDITAHRQAEQLFQATQRELEAVYEQAPVVMVLLDENLRVIRANRAAYTFAGYSPRSERNCLRDGAGDVLRCIHAVTAPEGCGSSEACLKCLLRGSLQEFLKSERRRMEVECQITIQREGNPIRHDLQGSVSRLEIGGQKRLLLCLSDETARNRAEAERDQLQQQLYQAQKMEAIGQLAGGVAHDFNNILAAMMMHHEELLEEQELPSFVRNSLKELSQLAERAANLTRQLLQYSRRAPMEKKVLNLNHCVGDMQKLLRRTVGEHIQLNISPTGKPVNVSADAGMLGQVVLNLAVNARDAMPKGGILRIAVGTQRITEADLPVHPLGRVGRFATLSVTDTGTGITPEVMARMFEPFFTTKEPGKGTGLGLATVEGIVKQHDGWVEVTTELGKGSTFTVFLPLVEEEEQPNRPPAPSVDLGKGSEVILLVEDEPAVRRAVANGLRRAGYQVLEAGHGVEAMQLWKLNNGRIDVVFSDMVLPGGMSGLDLIQTMRANKPDLRVIFSTGYNLEQAELEAAIGGKYVLLPKPYTITKLTSTIRELLGKSIMTLGGG